MCSKIINNKYETGELYITDNKNTIKIKEKTWFNQLSR